MSIARYRNQSLHLHKPSLHYKKNKANLKHVIDRQDETELSQSLGDDL
jgi:hypothetical protein